MKINLDNNILKDKLSFKVDFVGYEEAELAREVSECYICNHTGTFCECEVCEEPICFLCTQINEPRAGHIQMTCASCVVE